MRDLPKIRTALWITNGILAGAAAWMLWSLTRPPEHALELEPPPEAIAREPIELPPVEVTAEPRPKKPARPTPLASIIPSGPLTLPPVRVQGDGEIALPETLQLVLARQGIEEEHVQVRLCLDAEGNPTSSRVVASSGLPEIEGYVQARVMRWRYLPLVVGGESAATCTWVHLRYLLTRHGRSDRVI